MQRFFYVVHLFETEVSENKSISKCLKILNTSRKIRLKNIDVVFFPKDTNKIVPTKYVFIIKI